MKKGFYYSLACEGMRKNKRLYVPYILTCVGMVMMLYIVQYLHHSEMIRAMSGGSTVCMTMALGGWVIAFFSVLFLLYTGSFLMRRRRMEFGLYNMLGMSKRNITNILAWEVFISFLISVTLGLISGMVLSKLAELILIRVLDGAASYSFSISHEAVVVTIFIFVGIFAVQFLNAVRQIRLSTVTALMQSENVGERPPKSNVLIGVSGFVILAAAYGLAVSIEDPIAAMLLFFVAVMMVIAATYLIFIAGMVLLCRLLQKNKSYYYKARHFVSVSSMAYRMKRNGAGLASICILATMVLVMLSSTASLYFGAEDMLNSRYPRQINNTLYFYEENLANMSEENTEKYAEIFNGLAAHRGVKPTNVQQYRALLTYAKLDDTVMNLMFVPLADYNRYADTKETLADDEVLIYPLRIEYDKDSFKFEDMPEYKVKKQVEFQEVTSKVATEIVPTLVVVVPDTEKLLEGTDWLNMRDENGDYRLSRYFVYNFDTQDMSNLEQIEFGNWYMDKLTDALTNGGAEGNLAHTTELLSGNREDFYGTYGGLFFLAILLSIVFIAAAVQIIYYKQISEGYEDQSKFAIMQKVGMTKAEIKRSINSQVLTVFFLPLLMAGLHMIFAFPMIRRILYLFNLMNVGLFVLTTVLSFLAFAVLYIIVYRITSRSYYKIVS